jgi:hypothetical protein
MKRLFKFISALMFSLFCLVNINVITANKSTLANLAFVGSETGLGWYWQVSVTLDNVDYEFAYCPNGSQSLAKISTFNYDYYCIWREPTGGPQCTPYAVNHDQIQSVEWIIPCL